MLRLGAGVSLCCGLAGVGLPAAEAQSADPVVHVVKDGPLRVIAPEGAARDATYDRVIRAAQARVPLPGLPSEVIGRAQVTISLAARVRDDLEAWTSAADGLIVVRLTDVEEWSDEMLQRVIRHEVAHVGLARYLEFAKLPRWFSEGYSEWAVGGVPCAGEVRLHLYFRAAGARGGDTPSTEPFGDIEDARLAYDAYASFFDYLESGWKASIRSGRFLANVRSHGVDGGVRRTFGVELRELERRWRRYASRRYAQALDAAGPGCAERRDVLEE